MAAKLTRLTHLVAERCIICSWRSSGQSGNFGYTFVFPSVYSTWVTSFVDRTLHFL